MINEANLARDAQALVSATLAGEDASALWLQMAGDREDPRDAALWSCGLAVVLAAQSAAMIASAAGGDRETALKLWQSELAAHGADSDTPEARRLRGEADGA